MTAQAMQLLERGQTDRAMDLYRDIVRYDAENTDALVMLAAINGELGNVEGAIAYCRRALQTDADDVEANVILARLLLVRDEAQEAADCLRAALAQDPEYGEAWASLASIEGRLGLYEVAEKSARNAIRLLPDSVDGYASLVNVLMAMSRFVDAKEPCAAAVKLDPDNLDIRMNLAVAYERSGDLDGAEIAYGEILRRAHRHADASLGMARILIERGDFSAAEQVLLEALKSEPENYNLYYLLARLYEGMADYEQAESFYRKALMMAPEYIDAWINMGNVQQDSGQYDAAMSSYASALKVAPESAEAHYNKGLLEKRLGRFDDAIDSFNRAIEMKPEFVQPHWNKSFVCLLTGRLTEGWKEYEWRLQHEKHIQRPFTQPAWEGEDLNGRTILVHDEQGYGDTFQFVRYLPLVQARGARVVFECHDKLGPVLRGCKGYDQLIERVSVESVPDASFDVQVSLMSLPRIFNTRLESIPAQIPYLKAAGDLAEKWKVRLENDKRFRVGICWAGSPRHTNELVRSCSLQDFSVLSEIEGLALYSLQKGAAAEEAVRLAKPFEIVRLDLELDHGARFVDTAAAMASLDLVISIDTSIAHLAGALGRPVWILLSSSPDWRWMAEGETSPWYPTMRLFRQSRPGDWQGVFRIVAHALTNLLREQGR